MVLIPRVIHNHALNLMDSYETKPKINVRRLVIERRWYWRILTKSRSPRIDDECLGEGRFSSQTFRRSSLISGRSFLDAERKAFVRAIEVDLSPRGDDWICREFIAQLHPAVWRR